MNRLHLVSQAIVSTHVYDYVIVGGGISGLQAAQILTLTTKSVLILQAQSVLGGRIQTMDITDFPESKAIPWVLQNQQLFKKVKIQKGATWVEERHYVLRQLCRIHNIPLKIQFSEGQSTFLSQKSWTNQQLLENEVFGKQIRVFLTSIDKLAQQYNRVLFQSPKKASQAYKSLLSLYDSMTVTQYLQKTIPTKKVRDLIQNFLQHTECISCDQNSMHQVLTKHARSNDVGILKEFLGLEEHQPSYLLEGSQLIITKYVELVQKNIKANINSITKLNTQVIQIDNNKKDQVKLTCITPNQGKASHIYAKHVICAVPLQVSRNISFTDISAHKRLIFDNQLRTNALKTFIILKKPFWRQLSKTGDGLFASQYMLNMCHDISPEDQSCGIIVFFHNGKKYHQWKNHFNIGDKQAYEEKKKYIKDVVAKMFNLKQGSKQYEQAFQDFYIGESSFMENPHIRSGFQSNTRPGTFTAIVNKGGSLDALYADEKNITFIGSQFSDSFASYIEGAIRIARKKLFKMINREDPLKLQLQTQNVITKPKQ